jgi:hypothetical protein
MPLCSTCESIPFRALDRLVGLDVETKLAAGLENVVWLNFSHGELKDEDENNTEPKRSHLIYRPWVRHKTVQQIYEEAPKCVLCRILCLEPSTTSSEEELYDGANLREGFFNLSSTSGVSSGNEIIWMMFEKDYIKICHGNQTRPDNLYPMDTPKLEAYFSVRNITGSCYHSKDSKQVLM